MTRLCYFRLGGGGVFRLGSYCKMSRRVRDNEKAGDRCVSPAFKVWLCQLRRTSVMWLHRLRRASVMWLHRLLRASVVRFPPTR